jgi:hypothetical protein
VLDIFELGLLKLFAGSRHFCILFLVFEAASH